METFQKVIKFVGILVSVADDNLKAMQMNWKI